MKAVTLTPSDVAQFAESGRHALRQFHGQYALLRPKFPTITDETVAVMTAAIESDPLGTGKTSGIDGAVFFAALFQMSAHNFDATINALGRDADAATLHSLFQQTYACANTINALTLYRDGMLPQLHVDEAQSVARKTVAKNAAKAMHAANADAKAWVLSEWAAHGAEYGHNKTKFANAYAPRVKEKYPKARDKVETIKDDWLPKSKSPLNRVC